MTAKPTLLEQIQQKTGNPIATMAHAEALAKLVASYTALPEYSDEQREAGFLLMSAMQQVVDAGAGQLLRAETMPRWIDFFDRLYADEAWRENLVFLIKIFAIYGGDAEIARVIRAARDGFASESFLWSVIFRELGETPDDARPVLAALGSPLPQGFIAVALLDLANRLWLNGDAPQHIFDTDEGETRLRAWLTSTDPAHESYAHSAAAALAAITAAWAPELLAIALQHRAAVVRLEAAWATARRGGEIGDAAINVLVAAAVDPRTGRAAMEYLKELGHLDRLPPDVNTLSHWALCEMAAWLQSPFEMGRPPDELKILDHRRMWWPPTKDERDLWLIEYRYAASEGHEASEGVGCVGSTTFALFGEATIGLPVEDLYGLYVCWELESRSDPRAPKHRSALAGRKMLGFKRR